MVIIVFKQPGVCKFEQVIKSIIWLSVHARDTQYQHEWVKYHNYKITIHDSKLALQFMLACCASRDIAIFETNKEFQRSDEYKECNIENTN